MIAPSTRLVRTLAAIALAGSFAWPGLAAAADGPPNVILIVTDDQGGADLGVHGNRDLRTPNLDRLAAEGVRFARFYAEPVCTPTRAELMTVRRGGSPALHKHLFRQWSRVWPDPDRNWPASDGRFKLANGERFDLEADPGETTDVAARHPEVARGLRTAFDRWFADVTAGRDYGRVPLEVGRGDEDSVELDETWAEPVGRAVKPTYRRYNRDAVLGWTGPGDVARWTLDVMHPGRYEVVRSYGCRDADAGSRFRVSAGESHPDGAVEATGGRDVFRPRTVGAIELSGGPTSLEIRPLNITGEELMILHKV